MGIFGFSLVISSRIKHKQKEAKLFTHISASRPAGTLNPWGQAQEREGKSGGSVRRKHVGSDLYFYLKLMFNLKSAFVRRPAMHRAINSHVYIYLSTTILLINLNNVNGRLIKTNERQSYYAQQYFMTSLYSK